MNLLIDLTEKELVDITPEQKQQIYLLELADRGIALPNSVPAYMDSPANRDDLQPDIQLYSVGSGYSNEFWFDSIDKAQAVADLISSTSIKAEYDYRSGMDRTYYVSAREPQSIEAKTIPSYSMDTYSKLKDELKKYGDMASQIKKNNERRQKILDEQEKVMSEIDDAIAKAERNVTRVNEFAEMYKEYLKMAENNPTIAAKFLLNAHYAEVHEYEDEKLETIGISRELVTMYQAEQAKTEE